MCNMLKFIASILLIIGGINWGLIGLFDTNVVAMLFGQSVIAKIVYIAIGISAVIYAFCLSKCCGSHCDTHCDKK